MFLPLFYAWRTLEPIIYQCWMFITLQKIKTQFSSVVLNLQIKFPKVFCGIRKIESDTTTDQIDILQEEPVCTHCSKVVANLQIEFPKFWKIIVSGTTTVSLLYLVSQKKNIVFYVDVHSKETFNQWSFKTIPRTLLICFSSSFWATTQESSGKLVSLHWL